MSEELKISAYGYTSTKNEFNLDNLFVDGRTVTDHTDPQVKISKIGTGDIQVYAVSDAGAMATSPDSALKNSEEFFVDLGNTTEELEAEGKVDREPIWELICDSTDKIQARAYRNDEEIQGLSFASLFFQGNRGLAVHAGDCRIYVIRGGRILRITEDHLKVTELLKHKVITPEQMDIRKKDSELTAYVGMDDVAEARERFFSKYFIFYPDDMFLLCTDGLSDTLRTNELERLVRQAKNAEPTELLQALCERAYDKNEDDFAAILLKIENTEGEAPSRGSQTIPQVGSFSDKTEKEQSASAPAGREETPKKPAAPVAPVRSEKPQDEDDYDEDDEDEDDDDDEEGFSLAGLWAGICAAASSVGAFFARLFGGAGKDADDEDDYDEDDEDEDDEDDEDDDEEEGFLSRMMGRLRQEPKLAAIAAGIVVMLVLLIVLMASACRDDRPEPVESKPESRIESTVESEPDSEPESEAESEPESEIESEPESVVESEPESQVESEPDSPAPVDGPRSYVVKSGDGWGTVTRALYPEYADANWNIISAINSYLQTYNDKTKLTVGSTINGPSLEELKAALDLE